MRCVMTELIQVEVPTICIGLRPAAGAGPYPFPQWHLAKTCLKCESIKWAYGSKTIVLIPLKENQNSFHVVCLGRQTVLFFSSLNFTLTSCEANTVMVQQFSIAFFFFFFAKLGIKITHFEAFEKNLVFLPLKKNLPPQTTLILFLSKTKMFFV